MEYIEKKAALNAIWQGCGACAEELEQLPVVEIVRCKDCKWCLYSAATPNKTRPCAPVKPEMWNCGKEKEYQPLVEPDGFCSEGERKES